MLGSCLLGLAMSVVLAESDSPAAAKTSVGGLDGGSPRELSAKKKPLEAKEIERRLMQPVACSYMDTPLRQVLSDLRWATGLDIVLDAPALQKAGVAIDTPVSLNMEGISLTSTLNLIVKQVRLHYIVKDEVVLVTTEEGARGALVERTYPVADLVVPVDVDADVERKAEPQQPGEEQIMELIRTTVAPKTWREAGGHGTMEYSPRGLALVIRQHQDVHEEIHELLTAVRRLQELQVALDVRLVRVCGSTLKKLCVGCEAGSGTAGDWDKGVFLNDRQVALLLAVLRSDARSHITRAPSLILFNGQVRPVDVNEEAGSSVVRSQTKALASGWKYKICPVVSADRRSVRVSLDLKATDGDALAAKAPDLASIVQARFDDSSPSGKRLDRNSFVSTLSLQRCFTVPVGKSALLYVGRTPGPKAGSKKVGGAEVQHFLVLVKPYIIVNEITDEEGGPLLPPLPRP
jgi:hypothetical protein